MDDVTPIPPPSQPSVPINPTPQQPPSSNSSWPKWVILMVLIALLSSGGTYFVLTQTKKQPTPTPTITPQPTPTPDPTANWNVYVNPRFGFSIKYPPNLTFKEHGPQIRVGDNSNAPDRKKVVYDAGFRFLAPLETNYPEIYQPFEGLYIDVIDNAEGLSLKDFIEKVLAPKDFKIEYKPFVIAEIEGLSYGFPYQGGITKEIMIKRGTKLYNFQLEPSADIQKVNIESLYQSLSTFKFTQ